MSNGTQYNNHRIQSDLHDAPEHAYLTGSLHGKQTAHTDPELSGAEQEQTLPVPHDSDFGHRDIAMLAYRKWHERGCPDGSPDEDWVAAVKQLRLRHQEAR